MGGSLIAALALVEKVIEAHETIFRRPQTLEQRANDTEALHGSEKAQETHMPMTTGMQGHVLCARI
jgi:hypothetical protein